MAKISTKSFTDLLKKLSSDPKIKEAIRQASEQATSASHFKAQSAMGLIKYLLKYTATFLGKKKAQKFNEYSEYVVVLITVSLILKKNIFDRPEVKEFFVSNWQLAKDRSISLYDFCQDYVRKQLENRNEKKKRKKAAIRDSQLTGR